MRVLLANSTCKVGGVSTFMLSLRAGLVAAGHECELFFFSHGSMTTRIPADVPVHYGSLADCLALVRSRGFDVVHANNIDWVTGISAVRQLGVRLVATAHKVRAGAWTYGWTSRTCDALAGVSRATAQALQPYTDLPVRTIYNGIDTGRFWMPADDPAPEGRPIVAWIGRSASPLKGFERFAAIATRLHASGIRIWAIDQHGADKGAEAYPAAAAALAPIAERWDSVEFAEMPALYRAIAASNGCVLSTSVSEGLGLAMIEAQACGCLAVASDIPGLAECVVPEYGGLRVPLEVAPAEVARTMVSLLDDKEEVRRRRGLAADYARTRFSAGRMVREYLDAYAGIPAGELATASADGSSSSTAARDARRRLSPMWHWSDYLEQRYSVGVEQLETSRRLARKRQWDLAAGAGLAAFQTSPTIFLKPARAAHLLGVLLRARPI
jgi:glycosyltransferase involved in cell wall biosynthesis